MAPDFPKMEEQELMQSSLTKGCPLLLSYLIIPVSGPLHQLFLLPVLLFPRYPSHSLISFKSLFEYHLTREF